MSKRLIVHIGGNKTGSSAIQRFLAANCLALREAGIVVPDSRLEANDRIDGFHVFCLENLIKQPDGQLRFRAAIDELAASIPETSTILLSAENLAANSKAPALFEGLADRFELRIILYIRRQDEYLLSSWQQWNSKIASDFWAWATAAVGSLGNWRHYLEHWEAIVPREQICVRVFERRKLDGGDVVTDFLSRIGVPEPFDRFSHAGQTVNPSYSDAVVDLVKGNPLVFEDVHDNDFYNLVGRMTGDRYVKSSRQSAITFAQRLAIVNKYAASNRWVKEHYLPDMDGNLFSQPRESDYEYVSNEGLQQQKLEFLATMLYRMHKHGKG